MNNNISSCEPMRVRKISTGSDSTDSSYDSPQNRNYDVMNFEEMMVATDNMDTDVFENTRQFNPRKHRSCHRRAEPVSEDQRKWESSKNSREYTKRNRDEIKVCQTLYEDIVAKKTRLEELMAELKPEVKHANIRRAVVVFEEILRRYTAIGEDIHSFLNVPKPEMYLAEYLQQAAIAETLVFKTGIESYEEKLQALHEQFAALSSTKEALNSQKDKTNYASSKSRLKQRIVRAQLKTHCWKGWNAIETMRLQGKHLRACEITLKKQLWFNILAVYRQLLKVIKVEVMNIHDRRSMELIHEMFVPYSNVTGTLTIGWVPKPEQEEKKKDAVVELIEPKQEPVASQSPQDLQRPQNLKTNSPMFSIANQMIPAPVSSPSFTLSLPTVPMVRKVSAGDLLAAPTGLAPMVSLSPRPLVPVPTPKVSFDEEYVDVETIAETPRKRKSPSLELIEEVAKKPKTEEESSVTVAETGLPSNVIPQSMVQHAIMMNRHLLPPPLVINPGATNGVAFPQMMINSPYFSSMLTPSISPEMLSAIEHQKQIQKLLHDKFSRITKQH